jgi:3-oxoadipate enol-lactonase
MPKINLHQANFYYELHGKGQPLILIAGYSCDHTFWLPILDTLSAHFQVLVFDNRGIGQTEDDGGELSAETLADDVVVLARKLGLQKPHVVGHSMGGNIATMIGAHHGHHIGKLCILASTYKWRLPTLLGLKSHLRMRQESVNFETILDAALPWIFGQEFFSDPKKVAALRNAIIHDPHPQSIEDQNRQIRLLEKYDGTHKLSSISSPTLICSAEEDIVAPLQDSKFLASKIAHSKLVELQNTAHGMIAEVPEAVSNTLISFLKEA